MRGEVKMSKQDLRSDEEKTKDATLAVWNWINSDEGLYNRVANEDADTIKEACFEVWPDGTCDDEDLLYVDWDELASDLKLEDLYSVRGTDKETSQSQRLYKERCKSSAQKIYEEAIKSGKYSRVTIINLSAGNNNEDFEWLAETGEEKHLDLD